MDAGGQRIHRDIAERMVEEMADQIGKQHQPADEPDLPEADAADQVVAAAASLRIIRRRRACAAVLGQIAERRARQRGERQRPRHVDGGEPEPRGQQPVENAFAEPLRQFRRDAMAEHLLDQAVARRHAAGDGDMSDDVAHQPDHAERARPSAIEPRQLPDQAQGCREHEQHVDQRRAG